MKFKFRFAALFLSAFALLAACSDDPNENGNNDSPAMDTIDVTNLKVGETLHIGEISAPAGVEILGDKKIPVLAVAAPVAEAAETTTPAAGEAAKQPEMIKEKKEEAAPEKKK
jgi:large subunit ribosomal protein L25